MDVGNEKILLWMNEWMTEWMTLNEWMNESHESLWMNTWIGATRVGMEQAIGTEVSL